MTRSAQEIFHEARGMPPSEQGAYLEGACGGDAPLRAKVEGLLKADAQAGDFLKTSDESASTTGAAETIASPLREGPGTRIGPYRLLQLIGEGGFGSVFMAEQEHPVRRRAALKIIKLGMDTRQVVARFEQERQALAMMDHPNIAKVLDAGATETGRPYFVMELVRGEPITEYCDRNNLSIQERLDLFEQVCHAVQHAHQKGIIHRDLKPSNVLVTSTDGKALPKVIDFGIAKAMAGRLTEKTLFTEHRQLIGTPEYMSPEQAEMTSSDVDTRSDIYSLGVLLYELLTGALPFDPKRLRSAAFGEIQRIIREEDPPKPSTRLSTLEALPSIAARRHTEPARLSRTVRGDLDWIVMKCLEKDRTRRYETANGLALDVQRHLAGEPVLAAPPSGAYRLRKFIRRNRGPVLAGSLVAASLVVGVAAFAWQASVAGAQRDRAIGAEREQTRERENAERERDRALKVSGFVWEMLQGLKPAVARGRDTALLSDMLDQMADKVERGILNSAPEAEVEVRKALGRVYLGVERWEAADRILRPTLAHVRRMGVGDERQRTRAVELLYDMSVAAGRLGRIADQEAFLREALQMIPSAIDPVYRSAILSGLSDVRSAQGDAAEAVALLEEAVENYRLAGDRAGEDLVRALDSLSQSRLAAGRPAAAEENAREALTVAERLWPEGSPVRAHAVAVFGSVLSALGRYREAAPLLTTAISMQRRFYRGDSEDMAGTLRELARVQLKLGAAPEAVSLYQEALGMHRRLFPSGHVLIASDLTGLGRAHLGAGQPDLAEPPIREALEVYSRLRPSVARDSAIAAGTLDLARARAARGHPGEAEPMFMQSIDAFGKLYPEGHEWVVVARVDLGKFLRDQGRTAEARAAAEDAVALAAKILPPGQGSRATAEQLLKELIAASGGVPPPK